ncbi:MAG: S41 family peptidase [bacterium]|nr:S41 family peptidase [bacterium]
MASGKCFEPLLGALFIAGIVWYNRLWYINPMVKNLKQNFVFFFLILVILSAFGLGTWFGRSQVVCEVCQPSHVNLSLFWEAWEMLEEKYVDRGNLDIQGMIYGAISGMVKSLDDPYTVFLPPEDTKRFIEDVKGSFEGVGMEIDVRAGQLQVVAPLEGTPAKEAGLKAGDKILAVNGESTADITIYEAVNLIRGPRGTEVVLTIAREDWKETKDITIVRGLIEIPSLTLDIREDKIAHLRLFNFSEKAAYDFREAAISILESDAEGIIFDLRNNPGGYLEVAQDIAGWFLEKDEIVAIEEFGGGERELYKAQGNAQLVSYPTVVLINEGSASASEILAGCLRDNRGVKLIGKKSFGKGTVQQLEKLSDGSSLKITIAKWLTPKEILITGQGLEPDVALEASEEGDSQLDKAIEILQGLN